MDDVLELVMAELLRDKRTVKIAQCFAEKLDKFFRRINFQKRFQVKVHEFA